VIPGGMFSYPIQNRASLLILATVNEQARKDCSQLGPKFGVEAGEAHARTTGRSNKNNAPKKEKI